MIYVFLIVIIAMLVLIGFFRIAILQRNNESNQVEKYFSK